MMLKQKEPLAISTTYTSNDRLYFTVQFAHTDHFVFLLIIRIFFVHFCMIAHCSQCIVQAIIGHISFFYLFNLTYAGKKDNSGLSSAKKMVA